jgi:hypothetical protein
MCSGYGKRGERGQRKDRRYWVNNEIVEHFSCYTIFLLNQSLPSLTHSTVYTICNVYLYQICLTENVLVHDKKLSTNY